MDEARKRWAAFGDVTERLKRRNLVRREVALAELVDMLRPRDSPQHKGLMLDWNGARQLRNAGFEIGSHSSQHAILSEETAEEQFRDLAQSRKLLEGELQIPVDVLAYPNGSALDFNDDTERAAAAANYRFAVTTIPGINTAAPDRHAIRRAVVFPEEGTLKLAKVLAKSLLPSARVPTPVAVHS